MKIYKINEVPRWAKVDLYWEVLITKELANLSIIEHKWYSYVSYHGMDNPEIRRMIYNYSILL
jgi:hypothetical protein